MLTQIYIYVYQDKIQAKKITLGHGIAENKYRRQYI